MFLIVAVVFDEGDVVEVAIVCCSDPDHLGGVGELRVKTVDAKKDKGGVEEVFHEDDAYLLLADEVVISLLLPLMYHSFQFYCIFVVVIFYGCPVLGNGRHETVGITFVMIDRIMVLRRPHYNVLLTRNKLIVAALGGCDAEQGQEVIVGLERLSFL